MMIDGPPGTLSSLKLINNQVLRKIKIALESDVKNWAYIRK